MQEYAIEYFETIRIIHKVKAESPAAAVAASIEATAESWDQCDEESLGTNGPSSVFECNGLRVNEKEWKQ